MEKFWNQIIAHKMWFKMKALCVLTWTLNTVNKSEEEQRDFPVLDHR